MQGLQSEVSSTCRSIDGCVKMNQGLRLIVGEWGVGHHNSTACSRWGFQEVGSRPISRVLSRTVIPLWTTSPQPFSSLPGSTRDPRCRQACACPLLPYLALLQVGFAVPSSVATDAVRSYRTLSPLPASLRTLRRFALCCTFRRLAPPRRYLAPCPLEPGLSSPPHCCQ